MADDRHTAEDDPARCYGADIDVAAEWDRHNAEIDAAYRRGATDALQTLMREWRGGSGHTDGNMWVNFTDIKQLLARYQTRPIPPEEG